MTEHYIFTAKIKFKCVQICGILRYHKIEHI